MKRKVIAMLQARTDSTRLPGKVLKTILDKPMIVQEIIRIERSEMIDDLILLTSDESSDDELADIVSSFGFVVFRGSKDNVLERFYRCSKELKLNDCDVIVRVTGDCPVHDAQIIDELIEAFLASEYDYMANCIKPIYPDGLDTEVFKVEALDRAYHGAKKHSELEHVTPYIRESGLFKIGNLKREPIHPDWRLTVDEPVDFTVVEKIYKYFKSNDFTFSEMVTYLEMNPGILEINSNIKRNEGYLNSLNNEKDSRI